MNINNNNKQLSLAVMMNTIYFVKNQNENEDDPVIISVLLYANKEEWFTTWKCFYF